jgi:hypothetical protein
MRTSYRLRLMLALLVLFVLAGIPSSVVASSPYEGRNFRFPVNHSDVVTVTFTDPLPVTSADVYFDIVIDGSTYDWPIVPDQRVYTIDWRWFPESTEPFIFALGTYGTISLNGVLQPTFDNELIQSVSDVSMLIYGPDANHVITLRGSPLTTDPVLSEKWSTLEFLPSNFTGPTPAEIDQIRALFSAAALVDYGFAFNDVRTITLPCTSGSFTITPRSSLGPDNFKLGTPQVVSCSSGPYVRIARADTGAEIAHNSTFTFPSADVAQLPIFQTFSICNDGGSTLQTSANLVGGAAFTHMNAVSLFIDPGTCAPLTVRFTATLPGTYTGYVGIGGNLLGPAGTTRFNLSATATGASPQLHVQSQTITRQGSLFVKAIDQVLVTDQNNQPVPGVLVTATYSGQSQGSVSGTTGNNGKVSLSTNSVLRPRNKWCFTVTALSKAGYVYNPAANTVTTKCE